MFLNSCCKENKLDIVYNALYYKTEETYVELYNGLILKGKAKALSPRVNYLRINTSFEIKK